MACRKMQHLLRLLLEPLQCTLDLHFADADAYTRSAGDGLSDSVDENCRGPLPPAVNLCRSCVGLGWLAQETTRLYWFEPPRSNTLHPLSSFRIPGLGVFVVGVTNWSGEGLGPKSL
jgi:hypothetical protein